MLKMYNEDKMSLVKIAKSENFCVSVVHRALKELGYKPRSSREQALKYSCNDGYFHTIDSEHKAYWLGYICADGTIYEKTNTDSGTLKIETKKLDEEIVLKFKQDLQCTHPIKHYSNKYFEGYECSRLVIKSNDLINDLAQFGIKSKKSTSLTFPKEIINNQYINAFIRGYFDGDGSICLYSRGEFDIKILGTEQFLNTIKDICQIKCKISKPKGNIYELRISSNQERKKFLTFIYKDATIYLQRKYDRFQLFLQKH